MRLTKRRSEGIAVWHDKNLCEELKNICDSNKSCAYCPVGMLIDRLCEYEDTGFEPDDINNLARIATYNAVDVINRLEAASLK